MIGKHIGKVGYVGLSRVGDCVAGEPGYGRVGQTRVGNCRAAPPDNNGNQPYDRVGLGARCGKLTTRVS